MDSLSIVVPWSDHPSIELCMEHNAQFLIAHNIRVVVVNGSATAEDVPLGPVSRSICSVIRYPMSSFNRALARNIGAAACSSKWLMFLDADVAFMGDFLLDIEPLLNDGVYVSVARMREAIPELVHKWAPEVEGVTLTTYYEETISANGRSGTIRLHSQGNTVRGGSGQMVCQRGDFIAIGGYDSSLEGYGYEDLDLHFRLQMALGLRACLVGEVIHLTHPFTTADNAVRLRQAQCNKAKCLMKYAAGHLFGSFETDRLAIDEVVRC